MLITCRCTWRGQCHTVPRAALLTGLTTNTVIELVIIVCVTLMGRTARVSHTCNAVVIVTSLLQTRPVQGHHGTHPSRTEVCQELPSVVPAVFHPGWVTVTVIM